MCFWSPFLLVNRPSGGSTCPSFWRNVPQPGIWSYLVNPSGDQHSGSVVRITDLALIIWLQINICPVIPKMAKSWTTKILQYLVGEIHWNPQVWLVLHVLPFVFPPFFEWFSFPNTYAPLCPMPWRQLHRGAAFCGGAFCRGEGGNGAGCEGGSGAEGGGPRRSGELIQLKH